MSSETLWQEISVAALLGTQRKPFHPPTASDELGALVRTGDLSGTAVELESEPMLLRAAAITALHRRAGKLPSLGSPTLPKACPPDDWPRCTPRAGNCLEQLLTSGKIDLLPEWIELAVAQRQRVREEHLALLLNQTRAIQPLRRALLPVLGQRGRWLAAQNPDWCGLVSPTDDRAWSEGQRKDRLAYLSGLREREPSRARELLAAGWAQEHPAEKIAFLEVMADALSMQDEPFLEAALDDRRKDVRQAAAALLARLPESRLVRRMTERAQKMLRWKPGLLRTTLEINLPKTCDESMLRDGIDELKSAGEGKESTWMAQVLGCVPPRIWTAAWNKRPAQILETMHKHELSAALQMGMTQAAMTHQDVNWLDALVSELNGSDIKHLPALFPRLPEALKEKRVLSLLKANPSLSYEQMASICLSACRHRWGLELTQAVTNAICWTLEKGELRAWRWEKLLGEIGPFFHPDLLEAVVERIGAALRQKEQGDPSVRHLLAVLEFRLEMRRAFTPTRPSNPFNRSK